MLSPRSFAAAVLPFLACASPVLQSRREGSTPAGCSPISHQFSWTLESFDFHASYIFTTPSHQNSWGYVDFNLTNPAVPFTAVCSGQSSQLSDFFYGTQIFTCRAPDDAPHGAGQTTFSFNRAGGLLEFNQTWGCADVDPQNPTTFNGYGAVNLTLACNDTTWTNPDWKPEQTYSSRQVTCAPVTLPVTPHQITAVA